MITQLLANEAGFDTLLHPYREHADRIMVGMNLFLLVICFAIAPYRGTFVATLLIGLPTLLLSAWLARRLPGALLTRLYMGCAFMAYTGLIIHQTGGDIEAHFSAFGLIGVLLYYRDWRVIVVATLFIYLHHLMLGYAQTLGVPVYVFDDNRFWPLFGLHVTYFLPFIGMMVYLAIWLRRDGHEAQHVISLAQRIIQGNQIEAEEGVMDEEKAPLITSVLQMKNSLLEHQTHLEEMVRAKTHDLIVALKKAEAANVAKTAFLSNMSHEMRTPLHQIKGMAGLVRFDPLTQKQSDRMDKLDLALQRMNSLVETILELTKIEADQLEFEEIPLAISDIVSKVYAALQGKIEEKGLQFKAEIEDLPTNLLGDPGNIQVALMHYADNAVRFTASGQLVIRVRLVAEDAASVVLRFEVEDTGIGIAPDALPRLFNIFEQADNSSTRKHGGAGLGLAMTKKIAQLMGGDAGCDSKLGEGSTFWFTVRLKKSAVVIS